MSEYYLADQRAEERAKAREPQQNKQKPAARSQDIKVTLLGDFLFPSQEPLGCDLYYKKQKKPKRETKKSRRDRR